MNKLKETLLNMQQWQKYAAIAGVFVFAIVVVILIYMNPSSKMVMVARNLSDSNRQEIETELNRLGVHDYVVTPDNSIEVPEDRATWIRTELSNLGLLSNLDDADEILLNSSLGESSSDQEARKLVATRTSIENQIMRSYTSVERASIQVTLPENSSIFSNTESKGAATVTLQMKIGESLTSSQIKGIQSMVSAAVDGLGADEVTIVDTQLGIISGADAAITAAEGTTRYEQEVEIQNKIAETLETNIEETLSGMFTSDQYRVNMNVAVDFNEVQRQSTTYGEDGILRSEQTENEISAASGTTEDAAGVESNAEVPNYNATDDSSTTYSQEIENAIRNYEIDETVEQVIEHPELRRTNAVVWVDEDALNTKNVNIDDFANAIALAAGLETDEEGNFLNGEVSIMSITFLADDVEEEVEVEEGTGFGWLIPAIVLGVFVIIGMVIFMIVRRKRKQEEADIESMFAEDDSFEEIAVTDEKEQLEEIAVADIEEQPPLSEEVIKSVKDKSVRKEEKVDVESRLTEAVKADKEKAAAIIKKWINQG